MRHRRFDMIQRLGGVHTALIEKTVGLLDSVDLLGREAATVEADGVDTAIRDRLTGSDDERRYVLVDTRTALYHHMASYMAELVNQRTASDDGEIIYFHFACQLSRIGHDDIIMQDTVMCYMAVSHNEVVIAYDGLTFAERSAVNGNELTEDTVVSDNRPCHFVMEFQILRDSTDHCRREYMAVLTHLGILADSSTGVNDTAVTYLYVAIDKHERTDLHILAYLGLGMNTC